MFLTIIIYLIFFDELIVIISNKANLIELSSAKILLK